MLFACFAGQAAEGAAVGLKEREIVFSRDILPILSDNCFHCHGPDPKEGRKGDLRLDVETEAKKVRDGHAAIAAGKAEESEVILRLLSSDRDEKMPPPKTGRALKEEQVALLKRWIDEGAQWGKHWSFEPLKRPPLNAGSGHPVDAIVDARLKNEGVSPSGPAPQHTLIRRLSLDLTGLPPTLAQLEMFLSDTAPGAWERAVDRMLASPAFGERMAWDWLDAARYADSNGYQGDADRTMWPWRDWVVNAFNQNLPFNEFTVWQLAGDLLPAPTHEQILATGFNRNHMINGEGGRIAEENRVDYVMDMSETMGSVWLGLTLNCCRCHDHKFDPLTQREYYQFTAFFNQTPVTGGGGNAQTPPVLDCPLPGQSDKIEKAEADWKRTLDLLNAKEGELFPRAANKQLVELTATADLSKPVRDALSLVPASRKSEQWELLIKEFGGKQDEYGTLLKAASNAKKALDEIRNAVPRVMVMKDEDKPRQTFLLNRGLYNQPGPEVQAAVPGVLPAMEVGDGRERATRLDLARWLVSEKNPLTARVAVNRFWQMLFGIGLIKTPEDFGVQAEYPVYPEILDWLASEFVESGWDVKRLLRTVVTSEAYKRSSVVSKPELRERDPDNRLLSRGPRFRMPSWMIRDQVLFVSGLMNVSIGGPPVFPYQPAGVWEEATFGKRQYHQSGGSDLHRRSLYTFWRRIVGPTVFFDVARRQVCEVKPLRTNTPMHALTTLNDITYVEAAAAMARVALKSSSVDVDRLRTVAKRVLCRDLSPPELAVWMRTIERSRKAFEQDVHAAERLLGQLSAVKDGELQPAIHAAWTMLCLNMLNLDETLTKE
jgi:mono/diheme cytochrome c family protein